MQPLEAQPRAVLRPCVLIPGRAALQEQDSSALPEAPGRGDYPHFAEVENGLLESELRILSR